MWLISADLDAVLEVVADASAATIQVGRIIRPAYPDYTLLKVGILQDKPTYYQARVRAIARIEPTCG